MQEQTPLRPLSIPITPEQEALNALEYLKEALTTIAALRQSLQQLRHGGFNLMPDTRSLKIQPRYRQFRHHPTEKVPEITLCGNWLQQAGFNCNQRIRVITMNELIIISPEAEPKDRKRRFV